jgi:hypothetical protein
VGSSYSSTPSTSASSDWFSSLKDRARGVVSTEGLMIFLIFVTIFVLLAFVVWLAVRIRRANLQSASLSQSRVLDLESGTPVYIDTGNAPATKNGQEFAYSFWVYIRNLDPTTDHKLVFLRTTDDLPMKSGAQSLPLEKANPIVFLDKTTNRLYISFITTNAKIIPTLTNLQSTENPSKTHLTSAINYVPLQRWVHITSIVHDATVTTYMDGELYSVVGISEPDANSGVTRPLIRATAGNIQVGDSNNKARMFMAKMQFFNYAPTIKEIRSMYLAGPANSGVLSKLGLPPYGIRSPIYRLDKVDI